MMVWNLVGLIILLVYIHGNSWMTPNFLVRLTEFGCLMMTFYKAISVFSFWLPILYISCLELESVYLI